MLVAYIHKWLLLKSIFFHPYLTKSLYAPQTNTYKFYNIKIYDKKPTFSDKLYTNTNSHKTLKKYLFWVGPIKKHYNIISILLYYAGPLIISSTKLLSREELFLNKFLQTYNNTINAANIIFISSPFIDVLKIRTKVKSKNLFTIQIALQFNILRQITLPFWVNTYNTWIEYFYILLYYKNYIANANYKYYMIINHWYKYIIY